jgi:serine/threonine protein kinase
VPSPATPMDASSNSPSAPRSAGNIQPGTVLQGRYRVQAVLGAGGMSTVYRARDLRFAGVDRQCAVKEMFQAGGDPRARQFRLTNFQREAALLATLSHPAIPRIYDFFEFQGSIYLVLELIQGDDLETMLGQRGSPFPEADILRWALELCDVLSFLHAHQPEPIIFRDLKPSNIMIRQDGRLVLIDFGIARSFPPDQKGTMIGTEGYSPPEQYRGVADVSGDIYALGATLHHLATGSDPRNETPFTFAQRRPRSLNPSLSEALEDLILKCVNYAPTDRFASIGEVQENLKWTVENASVPGGSGARTAVPSGRIESREPGAVDSAPTSIVPTNSQRVDWCVVTDDEVRGSATSAGGAVYVGSYDRHVYAIDEVDGTVRWRFEARRGVVSTPLPASELLIFGSEDHSVYAITRLHGRAVWSFRTNLPVRSSPRADDTSVFVGSDDGFLYRIERSRAGVLWRYRTWGPVRSTPLVVSDRIVFGSDDGHVYALARDSGQLIWRQQCGAPVVASPIQQGDIVIVGGMDGAVRALSLDSGRVVWTFPTGKAVVASAAIDDRMAYIASANGTLYALEGRSGQVRWEKRLCRQITSTPSIDGDYIYIGGADGILRCLHRSDGDVLWHVETERPIVACPLVAHEHVVVGSLDGRIYGIRRES